MSRKDKKVVRFRKKLHINIGILVFAIVLIYFLVYILSYATKTHVASYEVVNGQISHSDSYLGLILRSEKIKTASESGTVNYFRKEGDKVASRDVVCAIDADGSLSEKLSQTGLDAADLSKDTRERIREQIAGYMTEHDERVFQNVYAFKNNLNSLISEDIYLNTLNALDDSGSAGRSIKYVRSRTPGIVAFYLDGFEGITFKNFKSADYDPGSYTAEYLNNTAAVSTGDALYKLVISENWRIVVPLDEDGVKKYQNESVLNVTFKKDDRSYYAESSVRTVDGDPYLSLKFNTAMVRYIGDRYIQIDLDVDDTTGLKIPNSAITSKEFYVVPKEYITKGGDSNKEGVICIRAGSQNPEFVSTDLYYETEDAYYRSTTDFGNGDILQKPDSSDQMQLITTASLPGVYSINHGYTVFKIINVIAESEDYSIVSSGTNYGVSLYDHIALDASELTENQIIN